MILNSRPVKAALTTLAVLAAVAAVGPTPAGAAGLTDVPGHWAEEAITTLLKMGVVQGYPDASFKPENPVTRAEFSKMVSLAFGYAPGTSSQFADMVNNWAEPYVAGLTKEEVLTGYPDGSFRPSKGVTRAEAAAVLARVAGLGVIKPEMTGDWLPVTVTCHRATGRMCLWRSPAASTWRPSIRPGVRARARSHQAETLRMYGPWPTRSSPAARSPR